MNQSKMNNIIIYLVFGILALAAILIPFGIMGGDGYQLWYPIIAEYVNGDKVYRSSAVIFNGQNLASIYGELPFWKLFRFFSFGVPQILNLTLVIWYLCFFTLTRKVIQGIKKQFSTFDLVVTLIFTLLSPIVTNRVQEGHFNILFGFLPFFTALGIIFDKSKRFVLACIFINWFAFSSQSYQILSYYLFYIPLLLVFVREYETSLKKYAVYLSAISLIPFLFNLSLFSEMLYHAMSNENARSLGHNIVYSYITTVPADVWHLITTTMTEINEHRSKFLFHEVNYSIGAFFLLFFLDKKNILLKVTLLITVAVLFLFSMNVMPFNYLSKIQLINVFRVPQRSMAIPLLIAPVWLYARSSIHWINKDFIYLTLAAIVAIVLPSYEIFAALAILIIYALHMHLLNEDMKSKFIMILALTSLMPNCLDKLSQGYRSFIAYKGYQKELTPLLEKYSKKELRNKVFHFEDNNNIEMTYVAQSLGIRTMEGYGHPPLDLLRALAYTEKIKIPITTNSLYFPKSSDNKELTLKTFTVDSVITFDSDRRLIERQLEPKP